MRGKNLNAVEGMQRQKVRVARDDMGSMAAHREFKEFVVLRVTASVYLYINVNPLSCARQSREKASNILLIQDSGGTSFCSGLHRVRQALRRKAGFLLLGQPVQVRGEAWNRVGAGR
jgi:hypothetical protein